MTYYIEAVEPEVLPEGRDWVFIEDPNGDQHFLIANSSIVVLPHESLVALLCSIAKQADLPLRVAS